MINVKCQQCKKEFNIWPYVLKKGIGKFCSKKCQNISQITKIIKNCLICNIKFNIFPSVIKRGKGKYCSVSCAIQAKSGQKNYNWKKPILINCLICYNKFGISPCRKNSAKLCSRKCQNKWMSENFKGENGHGWIDGRTPINFTIRNSAKYIEWAKDIKERDDFICQICKIRGGKLRSNHIKKFSDYPEFRFNLNNGITICESCDYKFIMHHEEKCEDFFNFNLIERGYLTI